MQKLLFLILFILFSNLHAQTYQSGENKTMLIELYTSEGCSSCPVADDWLSRLKSSEHLFKTFIPMAFHVTYWDFLGWKDSFANVLHDNRQRFYANRVWKNRAVYTPQFVVNAHEYKAWFNNMAFPNVEPQYGGLLTLKVEDENMHVTFNSKVKESQNIYLNVAILGFDYIVNIKSGENEDRVLQHDFVVLKHHQHFSRIGDGKLNYQGVLPAITKDENDKAVVIWLSDKNHQIIQAVGGYL